jgi:hypothetical protein
MNLAFPLAIARLLELPSTNSTFGGTFSEKQIQHVFLRASPRASNLYCGT